LKKERKKKEVERPFGGGMYTNAQFFSLIRSKLRELSRWWPPINQCRIKSRRPYKGLNKRQKYEYLCNLCGNYFPDKEVSIDHIIPVGTLTKFEDLPEFCKNLFCEVDGLQCVCNICHDNKTALERLNRKPKDNEKSIQSDKTSRDGEISH
jgi:hypothetical protein